MNATSAPTYTSVWLVIGSTGEYSDRSEWPVCAFFTEEEAKDYVAFLQRARQELGPVHCDWEERDAAEKSMRAHDPGYCEDYTGTSWFVSKVDLVARGAKPPFCFPAAEEA